MPVPAILRHQRRRHPAPGGDRRGWDRSDAETVSERRAGEWAAGAGLAGEGGESGDFWGGVSVSAGIAGEGKGLGLSSSEVKSEKLSGCGTLRICTN